MVADFGRFHTYQQWFRDSNDIFKRSPIMKELIQPDREGVKKLEQFVILTLWG